MVDFNKHPSPKGRRDVATAKLIRRAQAIREGGAVQRFHTIPILGDASNARHQWNMAVLLMLLLPDYPPRLMEYILVHDVPERWVGDTPAPAKYRIHPPLGVELHKAEKLVERALGTDVRLTEFEQRWCKALDLLECMMFTEDQLALGNRNMELTRENLRGLLQEDWIPREVRDFAAAYTWSRTRDIVEGEVMGTMELEEVDNVG